MEGAKEIWARMREETFASIHPKIRAEFISEKVIYNDHEQLKDDPVYRELLSRKSKATKELDKWKFERRYPNKNERKQ